MMLDLLPWVYFFIIAFTLTVSAVDENPCLCGISAGAFIALLGYFSEFSLKTQIIMYSVTTAICIILPAVICGKKENL